jgi:hypothetical protein
MFTDLVDTLSGLDDAELTARFRELELQRRRLDAETAAVVAVVERRGGYRDDGHLTIRAWMRANANWSGPEVAACRKRARLLDRHPSVGDVLFAGHIGVAQAAELARIAANPRCGDQLGDALPTLLTHAEQLPYDDFRVVAKRWEILADVDGAFDDADAANERRTATVLDVGGGLHLRASGGDPITTSAMQTIFERFVEAEYRADVALRTELHGPDAPAGLLPRSDAQRRFDALVKIFHAASSAPPGSRLPDPVVNVIVDRATFEHLLAAHGLFPEQDRSPVDDLADLVARRCETDTGIPVHPDAVLQAALAGHIRRVVIDSDGVVTNMGRRQRLFTGSARVAAKLMATRCTARGCEIGVHRAQVDHIAEWERDHGTTDSANSRIKCGPHNRDKHRRHLTTRRDAHGNLNDHRADGTPILPVGQRYHPERRRDPERRPRRIRCELGDPDVVVHGWPVHRLPI